MDNINFNQKNDFDIYSSKKNVAFNILVKKRYAYKIGRQTNQSTVH